MSALPGFFQKWSRITRHGTNTTAFSTSQILQNLLSVSFGASKNTRIIVKQSISWKPTFLFNNLTVSKIFNRNTVCCQKAQFYLRLTMRSGIPGGDKIKNNKDGWSGQFKMYSNIRWSMLYIAELYRWRSDQPMRIGSMKLGGEARQFLSLRHRRCWRNVTSSTPN